MDNSQISFEAWFDLLGDLLKDEHGIDFRDSDSVRADYDEGKDVYAVVEDIRAEYED